VALLVALELIRRGKAGNVLVGGVDALCRLTYHGFNMLKLIDPEGTAPFDIDRKGMTVGEGAAILLLEAALAPPADAIAELRGGGLSCDAYHPSSPHPEGRGAVEAINAALDDAGIEKDTIDYINLHGTGTLDNDASEAKAVVRVFGDDLPEHSSVKGTFGHAVGAAGALGAASAALAIAQGFVPANIGCRAPDPELGLQPTPLPKSASLRAALTDSFGFGGNNAALVLSRPDLEPAQGAASTSETHSFEVLDEGCLTGAGGIERTMELIAEGERTAGILDDAEVTKGLLRRKIRRLKRLTRLALSLAASVTAGEDAVSVDAVYCGTRWGALSEFHDFMVRLYDSGEQFSSPTDFVGSVHNAMAGQVALRLDARGANVTTTADDTSFEEALFVASLLAPRDPDANTLLMGVDQHHEVLIPRLYPSHDAALPADGGGVLLLGAAGVDSNGPLLRCIHLGPRGGSAAVERLVEALDEQMDDAYGACWYGFPEEERDLGEAQLREILELTGFHGTTWDYRHALGQYASVSAVATALASRGVREKSPAFEGRGVLLLGLGKRLSALEIRSPSR